jgi:intracellular sulfur oxidation DsrE/DsrF family protein
VDLDARTSCLRAVRLVARSARLCASIEAASDQYKASVAAAERMVERAAAYFSTMKGSHEPHEKQVRVVNAALVEAQICVRQLRAGLIDSDDLALQAEKIERAVVRAEATA